MTPRELGPYLLLRKLSEDALGETYRAGQKSGDDVERVVLLYFLKTSQENAAWLAETATVGRRALKGLSAPTLADIVDSGEAAGAAYLAYEYISGVGLLELISQSRREDSPIPLEVGLHIVDRVANALLAAWEHESRMLHGFVVPHLVTLSNEGEVHLLGIEVASRLRRLLDDPKLESEVRSYLAPEVVPQSQAATTDDVYSLGALLYALITGTPLSTGDIDPQALVGHAKLADGGELPDEVRQLLRDSLAPAQSRARLTDLYERLRDLVLSDRYDATSFNLAVYLHRLFGEELDQADEEMPEAVEAEHAPTPSIPPEPVEPAAATSWESPDLGLSEIEPATPDDELRDRAADERRARLPYLAAAAVIALIAVTGTLYYLGRDSSPDSVQAADRSSIESPLSTEPVAGLPAGEPDNASNGEPAEPLATSGPSGATDSGAPATGGQTPAGRRPQLTEEALDRQVRDLVEKQSKEIEGALRDEYEREIAALRAQLAEMSAARTRQEAGSGNGSSGEAAATGSEPEMGPAAASPPAEPDRAPAEGARQLATRPSGSPTGPAASTSATGSDPSASLPTDAGGEIEANTPSEPERTIPSPVTDSGSAATKTAPAEPQASSGNLPSSANDAEATSARPEDTEAPDEAATAAGRRSPAQEPAQKKALDEPGATNEAAADEPEEAPVRFGELVTAGPGVVAPELERSVQPVYPMMARRLGKTATVDLHVLIDENGEVVEVERKGEEAGFGFDEAAIAAARRMQWKPATKNGVRVKIWQTVRIAFQP